MSVVDPKASPENQKDNYEEIVLHLLDKEIAAANPMSSNNALSDDLDALMSDLLKQAIIDSDKQEGSREIHADDVDQPIPDRTGSSEGDSAGHKGALFGEVDAHFKRTLAEIGLTEKESVHLRLVPSAARITALSSPPTEPSISPARVSREASEYSSSLPFCQEIAEDQPPPHASAEVLNEAVVPERIPVFHSWSHTLGKPRLVAGGFLVCLLAAIGLGMYHFAGSKGSSSAKSGVTPTESSFTTSLRTDDALPVQSALNHGAEVKNPPVPATNPAYGRRETAAVANKNLGSPAGEILSKSRVAAPQNLPGSPAVGRDRGHSFSVAPEAKSTPATFDAANTPRSPATPKEEKSAISSAPEISAASNPTTGVAAALASSEKKIGVPVVEAVEGSVGNKATEPTEKASPLQTSSAQPLSGSTSTRPVAAVPPNAGIATPQPPSAQPLLPTKGVTSAALISKVSPVYPELARRARTSGTVILDLQIDQQGTVVKAEPISGPALLRPAAMRAVLQWRYKPATSGGNSVSSQSQVSIVFNIID